MMSNAMAGGMQNGMVTNDGTVPPIMQTGGVGKPPQVRIRQSCHLLTRRIRIKPWHLPQRAATFHDQAVPTPEKSSNQV